MLEKEVSIRFIDYVECSAKIVVTERIGQRNGGVGMREGMPGR